MTGRRMFRTAILGAGGFLGAYLTRELLASDHEVLAVTRPGGSEWRLAGLACATAAADLADIDALRSLLREFRPQSIVNLAWSGVANTHHDDPAQTGNVAMTVQLVALAAELGLICFVGVGSQAEYGPQNRILRESDELRPTTHYGRAKADAGREAARLCADSGMRFAWLRVFSTYGAMDNGKWLIPMAISRLLHGEPVPLTGCEQGWSFLHARDTATAIRTVVEHDEAEGVFNLGHPEAPPLKETLIRLRDLVDPHGILDFGRLPYGPNQVMLLQPDIHRLHRLGWQPKVDLDAGLRETVRWFTDRPAPHGLPLGLQQT
ncbi:NAD(P)-dependent oxidoreductase [Azospirillum sp. A26]|uniref:NAD-dependent epimerase/dehydratase family protein n=1 Tax=Azospirillum sp. A26 TaxID=3160607 RepID=UPI0036722839